MTQYMLRLPLENNNGHVTEVQVWDPWPLTPDQWDRLTLILEAMRPGLVGDPPIGEVCRFVSTVLVTP